MLKLLYNTANMFIRCISILAILTAQTRIVQFLLEKYSTSRGFWYLPFGVTVLSIVLMCWFIWWVLHIPQGLFSFRSITTVVVLGFVILAGSQIIDVLGTSLYYHSILLFVLFIGYLITSIPCTLFNRSRVLAVMRSGLMGYFIITLCHMLKVSGVLITPPIVLITLYRSMGIMFFRSIVKYYCLVALSAVFILVNTLI